MTQARRRIVRHLVIRYSFELRHSGFAIFVLELPNGRETRH